MSFLLVNNEYSKLGIIRLEEMIDREAKMDYLQVKACPNDTSPGTHYLVIPFSPTTPIKSLAVKICEEAKACHPGLEQSYFCVAPATTPWLSAGEYANCKRYPKAPYMIFDWVPSECHPILVILTAERYLQTVEDYSRNKDIIVLPYSANVPFRTDTSAIWIDTRPYIDHMQQHWHNKVAKRQDVINEYLRKLWELSLESKTDGSTPPRVEHYHHTTDDSPTVSVEIDITFGKDSEQELLHSYYQRLMYMITTGINTLDDKIALMC